MFFSWPLYKIELSFFVCAFHLYMTIYSTNILSVGLSVRLQKATYGCYHPCFLIFLLTAKLLYKQGCVCTTGSLIVCAYQSILGPGRFNHVVPNTPIKPILPRIRFYMTSFKKEKSNQKLYRKF